MVYCYSFSLEEFTNVKSGISLLRAFPGNSIACVNRRIIQEEQQKKSNYKYAVLSLAFNFLLFFDRLNKVESEYLNVVRINKACELLAHGIRQKLAKYSK